MQLVLAGQSELADTLNRDDLSQLKQRIAVRLSLNPLTKEELVEYIEYRWQRAGGDRVGRLWDARDLRVDAQGLIVYKHIGQITAQALEAKLMPAIVAAGR